MNVGPHYLRGPLRSSLSRLKGKSLSGVAFSSTGFLATSPRCRMPIRIQPRLYTTSSPKSGSSQNGNRAMLAFALTLSGSAAVAILWYGRRPDTVRMDWGPKKKTGAVNPSPAPTSGKPVPPNDSAEKPFPVESPGPTSTGRSLSFVPAGDTETDHAVPKPYEVIGKAPVDISQFPVEQAILTTAPFVPPPITRDYPVLLQVPLKTTTKLSQLTSVYKYETWTFNDSVPGPFIRARAGDVLELTITNKDVSGNPHNIDCHAFIGPGGGSALTTVEENQTKTARFRLLYPGLYVYHCAAAPVPVHIANGMYGMIYVQPAEGDLPPVDKEYFVLQSEFYHEPPEVDDDGRPSPIVEFSYPNALREEPNVVVFNGSESALTRDKPLKANTNETVRIFFGNAGPNLTSSFHIIGSNFEKVYREGDVISPPGNCIQTVSVPPGSATIVDMEMVVPGTYALVDHAIFRMDKGAVGYLNVSGEPRPDIYGSALPPEPCVGCKLHP
ncbi:hypothetical protein UREG_02097 [Uncinocarpus reesii 1704]|uniref:Copper-containing nitrite reductase n=1 Tax=Uncinocarpus reesii (strain UAMH 1704) TaxID=336963 RepID=C4JKE0_UNCRE|nr:uncharacterized protein UREG_02097 [Uncinocarpus reesii 1704]EEP77248.1 hypothetical protein UREG_02097 [Uncinocarpus reesii 1704]